MRLTSAAVSMAAGMAAMASQAVYADVLHLRNSNTVRGVVAEQSERGIRMEVGLHMHVFYATTEVARLERESDEVNATLRAGWGRTLGADAVSGAAPTLQGGPPNEEGDTKPGAQRRREAVIVNLDLEETVTTPDELASQLGRPQIERTTRSRAGQPMLEWGYDIGDGLLRLVQFRRTAGGYMATDTYEERRDAPEAGSASGRESGAEEAGQ